MAVEPWMVLFFLCFVAVFIGFIILFWIGFRFFSERIQKEDEKKY